MKHPVASTLAIVSLITGIVAFSVQGQNPHPTAAEYIGILAMFVFAGSILSYVFRPVNQAINNAGRVLKRGVPSPEQIRQHFVETMGREPTIEEVAALHQMAKTEHNQALVTLGAVAGGALLLEHGLHHEL